MSTLIIVNSKSVFSKNPPRYLESQTLRTSKMSGVTPKAARVFWGGGRQHKRPLEGPHGNASTKLTYPLPEKVVKYLAGFRLSSLSQKSGKREPAKAVRSVEQETPEGGVESFEDIARKVECHIHKRYLANTCEARDAENHPAAIEARATLLEEFGKNSLSGIYLKDPPVRFPFRSAEIWLKEGAVPVAQQTYRIGGERG